jgi:hypothetical protein
MLSEQTAEEIPRLIGEPEFLSSANTSAGSIAKALSDGAIFFVMLDGEKWYPSFFSDSSLEQRQLAAVTKLLDGLRAGSKWQFFVTGKGSLGGLTPVEALRLRKFQRVKDAARGFAER